VGWAWIIPYPQLNYAELTLQGSANGNFELNALKDSTAKWFSNIGSPLAKTTFWLGWVWFDVELDLQGEVVGSIGSHDVDMKASANAGLIEGPVYQNGGWTWDDQHWLQASCGFCDALSDINTVNLLAMTDMRLGIGPHLEVDIYSGLVGAGVGLHAYAELRVNVPAPPCGGTMCQSVQPLWVLYGGLDLTADVGGGWGLLSDTWGPYDLFTFPIVESANDYPPSAPRLVIPGPADTINLDEPSKLNQTMFTSWYAGGAFDAEGLKVTCLWQANELGQFGKSAAAEVTVTHMGFKGKELGCYGPTGAFSGDLVNNIISGDLTKITVTVIEEDSAGRKSSPSNAVTVNILVPTYPFLQIVQYYPTPIIQNQAFTITGTASNSTTDLCSSTPQLLLWAVDGSYSPGGWTPGYPNKPSTIGTSCSAQLTIPDSGQHTVNFYIMNANGIDLVKDMDGNPIVVSITINVLASTPTLSLNPTSGPPLPGSVVTLTGSAYAPDVTYSYCFSPSNSDIGSCEPNNPTPTFTADSSGNIPSATSMNVPLDLSPGNFYVDVFNGSPPDIVASAPFTVTPLQSNCGTVTVTVTPGSQSVTPAVPSASTTYTVVITAPASGFGAVGETFDVVLQFLSNGMEGGTFPGGNTLPGTTWSVSPNPPTTTAGETTVTVTLTANVDPTAQGGSYQFIVGVNGNVNSPNGSFSCDKGTSASVTLTVVSAPKLTLTFTSGGIALSGSGYVPGETYYYCSSGNPMLVAPPWNPNYCGNDVRSFTADGSGNIPSGTTATGESVVSGTRYIVVYLEPTYPPVIIQSAAYCSAGTGSTCPFE
jgi:hypothetical protein